MMKSKRFLAILLCAISIVQLTGCGLLKKDELKLAIQNGEDLTFDVSNLASAGTKIETDNIISWVPLAESNTYSQKGFRSNFDKIFNTNIVTTTEGDSKQGVLYVTKYEGQDAQSGNVCMRDAFRNEKFLEYWNNPKVQNQIDEIIGNAYIDLDKTSKNIDNAALNAYYNLMIDEDDDPQYNGSRSLTREQFYTVLYKAGNPVSEIPEASEYFVNAVGGETPYTKFFEQYAANGWLTVENGGLTDLTVKKEITKFEALYLVVNTYFHDELINLTVSKNATAYGFKHNEKMLKELGIVDKEGKLVIKNYQPNLMYYTLLNPDKGMYTDMIAALGLAGKYNLTAGMGTDMASSITRNEVMNLLKNTYLAENKAYGYLTNSEYPNLSVVEIVEEEPEVTLEDLTQIQIIFFENVFTEAMATGEMTEGGVEAKEIELLNTYIESEELPVNAHALYLEWKVEVHPEAISSGTVDEPQLDENGNPIESDVTDETENTNVGGIG